MYPRTLPALAVLALASLALSAQATAQIPAASPAPYVGPYTTSDTASNAASDASASSSSSIAPDEYATDSTGEQLAAAPPSRSSSLPFSGIAVALKLGVGGIGFDVATPLIPQRLNLRGGASFLSFSPGTINVDGLNVNGTIKLQNASTMLDWFPFHNGFRLSAGATVYNDTGLTAAISVPTGQSFTVGDADYYSEPYNAVTNPDGPIHGTAVFTFGGNKVVPRATIGFGNMLPKNRHFGFETEIGFQYFSAPTVHLAFFGTGCEDYNDGVYSNCGPIPQDNITSQQDKLQNDLVDLRFYPILSFSLSYKIH